MLYNMSGTIIKSINMTHALYAPFSQKKIKHFRNIYHCIYTLLCYWVLQVGFFQTWYTFDFFLPSDCHNPCFLESCGKAIMDFFFAVGMRFICDDERDIV